MTCLAAAVSYLGVNMKYLIFFMHPKQWASQVLSLKLEKSKKIILKGVTESMFEEKNSQLQSPIRAGFHKPIYALCQALTPCAKLLRLKKLLKISAQSVKWLCTQLLAVMKLTPGVDFLKIALNSCAVRPTFNWDFWLD